MTHTRTHHVTTTEAAGILTQQTLFLGQPGGILIIDRPEGLAAHYTTNPGNMAGRMVLIDTLTPIEPKALRTPANLAAAINAALDDAEDGTDDRDQTSAESGPYWNHQAARAVREARQAIEAATDAKRHAAVIEDDHREALLEDAKRRAAYWTQFNSTVIDAAHVEANREEADRTRTPAYDSPRVYVDQPTRTTSHRTTMEEAEDNPSTFEGEVTTGRTYETQTLALELANIEPLYKGAREAIKANRQHNAIQTESNDDANPLNDADALEAYVADIMADQDTRNPRTALLVALANAATCRIDWSDVAAQLIEVDEISEEELEAAAAMMDKYNHTQDQ